jgi:hypothetical protein
MATSKVIHPGQIIHLEIAIWLPSFSAGRNTGELKYVVYIWVKYVLQKSSFPPSEAVNCDSGNYQKSPG